jgi:hypothetical protein
MTCSNDFSRSASPATEVATTDRLFSRQLSRTAFTLKDENSLARVRSVSLGRKAPMRPARARKYRQLCLAARFIGRGCVARGYLRSPRGRAANPTLALKLKRTRARPPKLLRDCFFRGKHL